MFNSNTFTPIFLHEDFRSLLWKNGGVGKGFHMRILEMVLFPGVEIEVVNQKNNIASVKILNHSKKDLFYTENYFLTKKKRTS